VALGEAGLVAAGGRCAAPELCNASQVEFKLGLKTERAVEGQEEAFANEVIARLEAFVLQQGAAVEPAFASAGLKLEPDRYVEFWDTSPDVFDIRTHGWIVRHRWRVPKDGKDKKEKADLSIKRRSSTDPKVHPEETSKMIVAEGVAVKYAYKQEWIASNASQPWSPAHQLYSDFKEDNLVALEALGFHWDGKKHSIGQWGQVVPELGKAGNASNLTSPNTLRIVQREVVLLEDGIFVSASGQRSTFQPSVILWFDEADAEPRTAFAGEVTWDMKTESCTAEAIKSSKDDVFVPLVDFLGDQVDFGAKTEKAYARMKAELSAAPAH